MSETSSASSGQQQQPPAASVKHITVYRNGDAFFPGRRFVVNAKQVGSYENLLGVLTRGLGANFGAVRSVFTPRGGHRLSALSELSSGGEYVASGSERFKKLSYKKSGTKKENLPRKETNSEEKAQEPPPQARRRVVSSRWKRPTEEPVTIFVFTNGDAVRPAVRILLTQKILGNWEHVLKVVTERVDLRTGAARRLCTLDGTGVMSGSFLESGLHYVAVGKEKFRNLPYGEVPQQKYFPQPPNGHLGDLITPLIRVRRPPSGRGLPLVTKIDMSSKHPRAEKMKPTRLQKIKTQKLNCPLTSSWQRLWKRRWRRNTRINDIRHVIAHLARLPGVLVTPRLIPNVTPQRTKLVALFVTLSVTLYVIPFVTPHVTLVVTLQMTALVTLPEGAVVTPLVTPLANVTLLKGTAVTLLVTPLRTALVTLPEGAVVTPLVTPLANANVTLRKGPVVTLLMTPLRTALVTLPEGAVVTPLVTPLANANATLLKGPVATPLTTLREGPAVTPNISLHVTLLPRAHVTILVNLLGCVVSLHLTPRVTLLEEADLIRLLAPSARYPPCTEASLPHWV